MSQHCQCFGARGCPVVQSGHKSNLSFVWVVVVVVGCVLGGGGSHTRAYTFLNGTNWLHCVALLHAQSQHTVLTSNKRHQVYNLLHSLHSVSIYSCCVSAAGAADLTAALQLFSDQQRLKLAQQLQQLQQQGVVLKTGSWAEQLASEAPRWAAVAHVVARMCHATWGRGR